MGEVSAVQGLVKIHRGATPFFFHGAAPHSTELDPCDQTRKLHKQRSLSDCREHSASRETLLSQAHIRPVSAVALDHIKIKMCAKGQ